MMRGWIVATVLLMGDCSLPINHSCHRSEDCVSGTCIGGTCSVASSVGNDGAAAEESPDLSVDRDVDFAEAAEGDGPAIAVELDGRSPEDAGGDANGEVDISVGNDAADGGAYDGAADNYDGHLLPTCGAAWAQWPMPAPPALTGQPNDPLRNLPTAQSYDTATPGMVRDNVTELLWQQEIAPQLMRWEAAARYCDALELAGRDDWRLPSRIELVSLIDFANQTTPLISTLAFPGESGQWLWSCASAATNPIVAWMVDFNIGATGQAEKVNEAGVSCVSGPAVPTAHSYDLSVPDEARDLSTNLDWKLTPSADWLNWGDAYQFCLNTPGGWRLPSLTELQTLVDEKRLEPAVDWDVFTDRPEDLYWTSSLHAGEFSNAWFVSLGEGNTYWSATDALHHARCVR